MNMIDWKSALPTMRLDPGQIPWRDRRLAIEQAAAVLRLGEDSRDAAELLRLCANDAKWQIRQAVAETLPFVPEALFLDLARMLATDSNHFVQEAVEQAGLRRSAVQTAQNTLHRGLRAQLLEIERKFGPDAARATMRFAERYDSENLGAVAHNLKTILTSLKSSARALAHKPDAGVHGKRLASDVEHLARLAKDISRFADQVKINPTVESARDFINESHRLAREAIASEEGKNTDPVTLSVTSAGDDLVPVSRTHIVILFANLIQNAIEAHEVSEGQYREGTVTVTIRRLENVLEISVADTGKGIPADCCDLLEFIPGRTSKTLGTGCGVPIARKYVADHGGTLAITSKPGEGTVVTVELPLER
jgi:cell cycle sensor histidine kinase DivJ